MPQHATSIRRRLATRFLFTLIGAVACGRLPVEAATVAARSDASIAHDESARTWTLAAGGATLKLGLDPSRDFSIISLTAPSGIALISKALPDTFVRLGDRTLPFGSHAAGFAYQAVTVEAHGDRLQLNATFDLMSAGLRVTRHYALVAGSPTFEVWTTYTPAATASALSDLNALELTVPGASGAVHWVTGLLGDAPDVPNNRAFTREEKTLAEGETLALGSQGRSSETAVPWVAIDGVQDELYAALMWSGAWSLDVTRAGAGLALSFGLAPMSTRPREPFDGPHAVFGVVEGGLAEATSALRAYLLRGIRQDRPLIPLVTYNTWFAYGTAIDESSMRAEMARAAALGVELFVVDAGWYEGASEARISDFDGGLGSWRPDPARFPNGLKPLADYAHSLQMKFGIWVEPERVNLSLVAAREVDESWLATHDGEYGSEQTAQLCFASRAARDWILGRLTALIDEVQPDYLKWDNNFWINCDRDGHGHGGTDGNFAHVNALYDVLAALRERYPQMSIENVSGGGNRLDLAMLRYTDVGWMDDRTAPSVHVRHNVEGLSAIFPPAYLFSFVMHYDTEPLHDAPDMSLYFRSRMASALGVCFRTPELSEADISRMTHEIAIYQSLRQTISDATAVLLTGQAAVENGAAWDVLQETASGDGQVLLYAFQTDQGVSKINIKPARLDPKSTYLVQSVDAGPLGEATGADLMTDGIDIVQSPNTAAHILILKPQ